MLSTELKHGEVLQIGDTIRVRVRRKGNKFWLDVEAPHSLKIGKTRLESLQSPQNDPILPGNTGEGSTP